jgi:hypothetical protein
MKIYEKKSTYFSTLFCNGILFYFVCAQKKTRKKKVYIYIIIVPYASPPTGQQFLVSTLCQLVTTRKGGKCLTKATREGCSGEIPTPTSSIWFLIFFVMAEHAEPNHTVLHRIRQKGHKRTSPDRARLGGLFSILHLNPSPTRQYTLLIRPQQPSFVFALYIYSQKAILQI